MLPDFPVGGWKPGVPTSPKFEELTMSRDAGHPQCVTSTRDRDHEAFIILSAGVQRPDSSGSPVHEEKPVLAA